MTRAVTTVLKCIVLVGLAIVFCTKLPSNMDKLVVNIGSTSLVFPADGSTDNILSPSLCWQSVSGATGYRVEVSTSSDFSAIAYSDSAVIDTITAAAGLKYKTIYYWRVQVHDAASSSDWSEHRIFTTIVEPQLPVAALPKDSLKDATTTVTLTWRSASGAASYFVEVATDTAFRAIVAADSTLADTAKVINSLVNNTVYYWRVRSQNPGGASAWTTTRTFTTIIAAPKAPVLSLPSNGALDQQLSLTLVWGKITEASGYYLQVATDIAFTNVFAQDSSLIDTTRVITGCANTVTYYWRVKAKNDGGASAWSLVSGFTTFSAVPQQPLLSLPADNAASQTIPLTLVWNKAVGSAAYHLQVAADSAFSQVAFIDSTLTDTSKSVGGLANSTKYFWRVRAKNPTGVSAWSLVRGFTTFSATLGTPVLRSPADGSTAQSTAPALGWQSVTGATKYRIQVSVSSDFSTIFFQDSGLTDTSRTLAAGASLTNSTMYYWRVRAENASGLSNWASPWRFTTVMAAPQVPLLVSPPDGSTGQQLSLTLTWNKATGAATYILQVSSDSGFATIVAGDTALTDTAKPIGVPLNNKTYFWRVGSKNAVGTSGWSVRRSFTTFDALLSVPALQSPQDGTRDVLLTQALTWSVVANASTYEVQVSTTRDFTNVVIDDATLTAGSKTPNAGVLANSTTYYWKVMARNLTGSSNWTDAWSFTTIITTPGTATPLLPADKAVDQPVSMTLTWNKITGAATYYVEVANDTAFGTIISKDSTLTDTTKAVSGLSNSTAYYWKVKGRNASGDGTWSTVRSFTTVVGAPLSTVLSSPTDGATDIALNPQLSWSSVSGAAAYHVQVSTAPDFLTGLVVDDSTYTQTTKAIGPLSSGTLYYWHVKAKNAGGASTWSSRFSFTTIPPAPPAPVLVSPADGATGQAVSLTLVWHKAAGASAYDVTVSTDTGFTAVVKRDSTASLTDTSLAVSGLANATTYYWHLTAKNAGGTSPVSVSRSFAVIRQFTISTVAVNGSVAVSPSQALYDSGTAVTVTAAPSAGYHFTGWSGDLSGTTNPATAVVNANKKDTAGFAMDAPAAPALVFPADGAFGQPLSTLFSWNKVPFAAMYYFAISTDPTFSGLFYLDSTHAATDTSFTFGALSSGTQYYWKVQARNASGTGQWSAVRGFAAIRQFTLSITASNGSVTKSPAQAQYDSGTVVSLTAVPAAGYHFTGWSDGLSGTTNPANLTMSNLMNVVANFASDLPLAPTLTVPSNNAVNVALSPLLGWASSATATKYHVQVSTLSDISGNIAFDDSTLTDTTRTVANLTSYTTYFWRVEAKNASGWSAWSAISKFVTTLAAPTLNSPADNAVGVSHKNPAASWSAVTYATSYRMQVSTDSTFASTVTDVNGTGAGNNLGTALVMNTKYYWRVRAQNANGSGDWSVVFSFTTLPVPVAPTPLTPSNDATNQPLNPQLTWSAVTGASSYHLQVSTHQDFSVIDTKDVTQTMQFINLGGLGVTTKYYWRVNASNSDSVGAWSTVWDFTTVPAVWTAANSGLTDANIMALAANGTNIFAGTLTGIFLSKDDGASWTAVNSGLTSTDVRALAVLGSLTFAGTSGKGVFLSQDTGASWRAVDSGGLANVGIISLTVSGTSIFAGTAGEGVFFSTNNGTSWTRANFGLSDSTIRCIALSSGNIFAGTDAAGVYFSNNSGTSWTAANSGLTANQIYSLAPIGGNILAGTGGSGIFLSANSGASWTPVNSGVPSTSSVSAFAVSGGRIFAGTAGYGVYVSVNNGAGWTDANSGLPGADRNIQCMAVSSTSIIAGVPGGGVFVSPLQ